jgi:lambda family phage tail tape measure protein
MAFADGQRIVNEALAAGTIDTATAGEALSLLKDEFELATDAGRQMQESLADSISQSMGDALMSVVDGTKSVGEAFRAMALAIARELFQVIVIEQMVLALKTAIGGFGNGGAFSGGSVLPNANGNAFSSGNVVPFANGGVVSSPTLFPMASGVGLMGEAGPEAIMPLSRGADGKLGVKASSTDGKSSDNESGGTTVINVLDPALVGQYLSTSEGRRTIMNIIGEERAA